MGETDKEIIAAPAILAEAHCFVPSHHLALPNLREELRNFFRVVLKYDDRNRLSDGFLGCVTVYVLSALLPSRNNTV
jgi:hypothetical protein